MARPLPYIAAENAIRSFAWDDYGMNEVDCALHDDPDSQEWVPALAIEVTRAILRHVNYGTPPDLAIPVAVESE